jgi:hypothetical protein
MKKNLLSKLVATLIAVQFLINLCLLPVSGQSNQYTFTTIVVGGSGTVTGAGTYAAGSVVQFQIAPGYEFFIDNVELTPQQYQLLLTQKLIMLNQVSRRDNSNLTNVYNETITLYTNITIVVTLATIAAPVAPIIGEVPTNQTVTVGSNVLFSAIATGGPPMSFQWQFNGVNIACGTNLQYVLKNAQLSDAGIYTFIASNSLGSTNYSVTLNVLPVQGVVITIQGVNVLGGSTVTNCQPVTVTVSGTIYYPYALYTLDGTEASFDNGTFAEGYPFGGNPFVVSNSAILNVTGYSADSINLYVEAPINIIILPVVHTPTLGITTSALGSSGSSINLTVSGISGDVYQIQSSRDAQTWVPLCTLTNQTGSVSATFSTRNTTSKLYRVKLE